MRWRIVVIACFVGGILGSERASAQASALPRFVPGTCHFKSGSGFTAGKNLTCGVVIVPERRDAPTGRQIRLAVAIFRTPSAHRRPDPVVFLQGGPGGAIVSNLGTMITRSAAPTIMGDRDLILIDQRGTGLSRPALKCPEIDKALGKALRVNASIRQQGVMEARALQACRDRFTQAGVDLSAYNTANDAADIADLRTALNLPEMNLYGVSYGTRVALAVMRSYPTGIRSVVLDSIVTPAFNIFVDSNSSEARAFDQLFAGCAQAPTCNASYPHLSRTFDALLAHLNAHPLRFKTMVSGSKKPVTVHLNGDGFAEFIRSTMYDTSLIPFLPRIISNLAVGVGLDIGALDLRDAAGADSDAIGMYKSVTCAEDAPVATTQAIQASVAGLPEAIRADTAALQQSELDMCKVWNVVPAPQQPSQAEAIRTPALLLGGQYDPITPPADVSIMGPMLLHSFGFVIPNAGHGIFLTSICAQTLIHSFYDEPAAAPNGSCVAKLKSPFF